MAFLWVFKRVAALNNQQGFVDVPDKLAPELLKAGQAAVMYDAALEMEPEPVAGAKPAEPVAPRGATAPLERQPQGTTTTAPQVTKLGTAPVPAQTITKPKSKGRE